VGTKNAAEKAIIPEGLGNQAFMIKI